MSLKAVSELIGEVYDAALEPAMWPSALEHMCHLFGAKAAAIQMFEPANSNKLSLSLEFGTDPQWTELLHGKYAALCPIGPILLISDLDRAGTIFNYIDEQEYLETRFYREWCQPQDYYDMIGSIIARRMDEVGTVSVLGTKERKRFSAEDIEMMGYITPHVRRAASLAGLLQHRSVSTNGFEAVMDALPTAVLLVGPDGRLVRANAAAEALLSSGSIVRKSNGFVEFPNAACDRAIRAAVAIASRTPQLVAIPGSNNNTKLTAAVLSADVSGATCAILIHEPKTDLPAHGKYLVETFGFTPREIAVLLPMMQGQSVSEIADSLGVALPTVRTHVARLFAKTGSDRQADLIRKVMSAMPPVRMN